MRTCGLRGGAKGSVEPAVEDDLAGDPETGALASNGQGPPSITDRLRSTADGARRQRTSSAQGPRGFCSV